MGLTRIDLQIKLEEILGSRNVYFQPPSSIKLKYPCVVYERSTFETNFADNMPYTVRGRYQITLIDENPDTPYLEAILSLPRCSHERHYNSDGLNHDVCYMYTN